VFYSESLRYLVQKSVEVRNSVSTRVVGCYFTTFCSFTFCTLVNYYLIQVSTLALHNNGC